MRKILSVLLATAMFIALALPAGAEPALQSTVSPHKNLVVVVRFYGDTEGDADTGYNAPYSYNTYYTCWQQFQSWFGGANIPYFDGGTTSLSAYMAEISNGTWNVTSYFPQSSAAYTDTNPNNTSADKTVAGRTLSYLTLPHDRAYYESAGDFQLLKDTAALFNADSALTSGSSAWGSNGVLDNLELVVQVSEEPGTSDTLLWPHKSSADGAVSFGGMKVYEYNLVNSKAVADLGTVKHEYLHSAGLGDLYRVGDTSSAAGPVGIWDIMGSAAGQWPLAQSLVDLGFESADAIKTVSGAATHSVTLHTHGSSQDDGQAVKVFSPYSSDEYFVFEYRQKSKDPLSPDRMVPSSGLIVYRVNNAVDRDVNGHRTNRNHDNGYYEDAVYVFRPGETGIHDSAGDLLRAALSTSAYAYLGSAANTRTSFGTADLSQGIVQGAIVDSSNRNSGIVVTVTAQTDDSITFDLTIPDYSSLSLWDAAGTAAAAAQADGVSLAAGADGTIYQSYTDSGAIRVRAWDGGKWTALGTAASGSVGRAQLLTVGSELWCVYAGYPGENNFCAAVKWNGGSSWSEAARVSTGSAYSNVPSCAVIGGELFLLADRDNTALQLYRLVSGSGGTSFAAVGGTLPAGYVTEGKLCSLNGTPAVVCGDVGANYKAATGENLYVLQNDAWTLRDAETSGVARNLAAAPLGASLLTFTACDKGVTPKVRLITAGDTISVKSFDFTQAGTDVQDAGLCVSGGLACLSVLDGEGLVTVWSSPVNDLTGWTQLGAAAVSGACANSECLACAASGGRAYVGAVSSSLTSVLLVSHALPAEDADVTIRYQAAAGGSVSAPSETIKAITGNAVGSAAAAGEGFFFVSWTDETGAVVSTEAAFVPAKVNGVYQPATYTANFAQATASYTVEHWQQNVSGDGYTLSAADTQRLTGAVGTDTAAGARTYSGFRAGTVTQQKIAADNSTAVRVYYDRETYPVVCVYVGAVPEGAPALPAAAYARFGAAFTPATVSAPDGYTFRGWFTDSSLQTAYDPASPVTGSLTLYGSWTQDSLPFPFTDVSPESYCYNAVAWAVGQKITQGVSATLFDPDAACTRAEAVTFLWRAMGSPEPASSACQFSDVPDDAYYRRAVLWAVEKRITFGTGADTFSPRDKVTREQVVSFLYRAAGQPGAGSAAPFSDVVGRYSYDAVLWAVGKGITVGTGANAFSPTAPCTRGQIVTFLYRYLAV